MSSRYLDPLERDVSLGTGWALSFQDQCDSQLTLSAYMCGLRGVSFELLLQHYDCLPAAMLPARWS